MSSTGSQQRAAALRQALKAAPPDASSTDALAAMLPAGARDAPLDSWIRWAQDGGIGDVFGAALARTDFRPSDLDPVARVNAPVLLGLVDASGRDDVLAAVMDVLDDLEVLLDDLRADDEPDAAAESAEFRAWDGETAVWAGPVRSTLLALGRLIDNPTPAERTAVLSVRRTRELNELFDRYDSPPAVRQCRTQAYKLSIFLGTTDDRAAGASLDELVRVALSQHHGCPNARDLLDILLPYKADHSLTDPIATLTSSNSSSRHKYHALVEAQGLHSFSVEVSAQRSGAQRRSGRGSGNRRKVVMASKSPPPPPPADAWADPIEARLRAYALDPARQLPMLLASTTDSTRRGRLFAIIRGVSSSSCRLTSKLIDYKRVYASKTQLNHTWRPTATNVDQA